MAILKRRWFQVVAIGAVVVGIGLATGTCKFYRTEGGFGCSTHPPGEIDQTKLGDFVQGFASRFGSNPGIACDRLGHDKGDTATCQATYPDGTTRSFIVTNAGEGNVSVETVP